MKRTFTIDGDVIEVDVLISCYHGELGIHYCREATTQGYAYVLSLGQEQEGELLTWALISIGYPWAIKVLKAPSAESIEALTPQQQSVLAVIPSGDLGVEKFKYEMQRTFQMTDGAIGKVFKNLLRLRCIEHCAGSKYLFRLTVRGLELQQLIRERDAGLVGDYLNMRSNET